MLFVPMTARASFCMRYASSFVPFDEAINAMASDPCSCLIPESLVATKPRASSQVASRNVSPSRMSGLVSRSWLFTKSHPNLPFTQVETPLAGPSDGSIFRIWRSFVQISWLQPTPQEVQTVLGRRVTTFFHPPSQHLPPSPPN